MIRTNDRQIWPYFHLKNYSVYSPNNYNVFQGYFDFFLGRLPPTGSGPRKEKIALQDVVIIWTTLDQCTDLPVMPVQFGKF